ncbi:MAG: tetratricopeptide repeat protein [Brevibacillus sp.]|nr:tetratricopeptide repeat protein [Brevibacillus sp.]
MHVDEWFKHLHDQLQSIEDNWPDADEDEKRRMAEQLVYLRQVSDHIVDAWISLEEKLSSVIKAVKATQQKDEAKQAAGLSLVKTAWGKPAQLEMEKAGDGTAPYPLDGEAGVAIPGETADSPAYSLLFRKGEGFYHLRLFDDAKHHFAELLKQSPDWESGRLYYGYSLLFCEEREAAMREFRLLARTAASPKIVAISHNAIGCMIAEEGHWLEAGQAFKAALETIPTHPEAAFNLALCYLNGGEEQEALETIEPYLERFSDDWEAQVLWLRGYNLLRKTDPESLRVPPSMLTVPSRKLDVNALWEMANVCEETGQIRRAQLCYRYLLELIPREGWVWHGLGWNTWLLAGAKAAIPLIKKAISLSPENLDFVFSYGWIQLFEGQVDEAGAIFEANLRQNSDHVLSISGLISVRLKQGGWGEASRLARHLLHAKSAYVRALGHYHLGRIAVAAEQWQKAEQHFRASQSAASGFWEVPLFLKLCADKLGRSDAVPTETLLTY